MHTLPNPSHHYPEFPGGDYRAQLGLETISITYLEDLLRRGSIRQTRGLHLPVIPTPLRGRINPAAITHMDKELGGYFDTPNLLAMLEKVVSFCIHFNTRR
jgi:hypothetical protein